MKKILFMLLFILGVITLPVFAEEESQEKPAVHEQIQIDAGDVPVYQFPVIKPEYHMFGGYNFMHLKGSAQAEEYRHIADSLVLGGEMRLITYPHRLHLDAEITNEKDYSADVSYAYSDLATMRFRNITLFHNLDNIRLSSGTVQMLDSPDKNYGIRTSMNDFILRLKAPDFPAHLYISGNYYEKKGDHQQISLLGAAYFNNRVRTSQDRDVDWTTKEVTVGANSLLGPVEVDISHSEKRFSPGQHHVLFNNYTSAGATRNAGTYPYSMYPETKSSANTLRLHTLYSGGMSASATITKIEKENTENGAKSDYFIGSGQIMWMPLPKLTFFLKYRHKDVDLDSPGAIASVAGIAVCSPSNNAAGNYHCDIRPAISSKTDTVAGIVRYRPFTGVTLKGEVSYEDIRRDDYEEWHLPHETERTNASISIDARLMKNLKLMTKYTHRDSNNPATNVEPDKADEGRATLSWMPFLELSTSLGYDIAKGKRDDIYVPDSNGNRVLSADDRDIRRQRFIANATYLIMKDLSVTLGYAYIDSSVKQDAVYNDTAGTPFTDSSVPYKDFANNYTFDVSYMTKSNFTINSGISYTHSKGNFYPSDILGQAGIRNYSKLETKETLFTIGGKYTVKKTVDIGLQYRYSDFNDVYDNPYDDIEDGKVHTVLLTLRKEW